MNLRGRCRPGGQGWVRVEATLTARVRTVVGRHGIVRARDILGVSQSTLDDLRGHYGRLQPRTIARVTARLDELERGAA